MKILIIGGTRFQGRYLVNELLDAGHSVTVFHKGSHAIAPRTGLVDIVGDRNSAADLNQVSANSFDACIDTCAYFPAQISLLGDTIITKHYCFISSVYVYSDRDALLAEDAQLCRLADGPELGLTSENYGVLKALCEAEASARFGEGCLILRPSIIIGTGDHTERMLFWMRLVSIHGKHFDFADNDPVVQLVDVRDLAHFTAKCVKSARQGAVNVCGEPVTLSTLLTLIANISGIPCKGTSVSGSDLAALGLDNLPYCEPGRLARYDTALSQAWGFEGHRIEDSLAEIHAHLQQLGFSMHGFQAEEAAVLRLFE
jgi:2'-hydroxyisoflavone reductase